MCIVQVKSLRARRHKRPGHLPSTAGGCCCCCCCWGCSCPCVPSLSVSLLLHSATPGCFDLSPFLFLSGFHACKVRITGFNQKRRALADFHLLMIIRDLPENSNNQKNGCFVAVLIETKVLLQFASISILRVTTDQINANGPSLSYRTEESKDS